MIQRPLYTIKNLSILFGLSAGLLAPLTLGGAPAPGFVSETDDELQTVADINGDGLPDLIVVDKATGQFRIAEGTGNGELAWRDFPGDSGLTNVTGFSAGPIFGSSRSALVFAEPLANRIQIVDASADSRETVVVSTLVPSFGPTLVTAINVPAGVSNYQSKIFDLLYHSTLDGGSSPMKLGGMRNTGNMPLIPNLVDESPLVRQPNRIVLETGQAPVYGATVITSEQARFHLYSLPSSGSQIAPLSHIDSLPVETRYVYADFTGTTDSDFVFFEPGSTVYSRSKWTGSALASAAQFQFSEPIDDIYVIESAGFPELIILTQGRTQATRAYLSKTGPFNILETFTAPSGEAFTSATSIGNKLHLLVGEGSGISQKLDTRHFNGQTHDAFDQQNLTPLKAASQGASVLLFNASPLTEPDARLLGRYDVGSWTSAFALKSNKAVVTSEIYQGNTGGLGSSQNVVIGDTPADTNSGLTNQIADDLSLQFQDRPIGRVYSQLSIEPASGTYSEAIQPVPTLSTNGNIFYRKADEPNWKPFNGLTLFTDTTLYVMAQTTQGPSNIVQANYTFTQSPGEIDSNGDGIPDFVAESFGLDPLSPERDSDGDGFTDLEEILAKKDPLNPNDHPNRGNLGYELPHAFDLLVTPGIPDPYTPTTILRSMTESKATRLTVHQPNGFFLGSAQTETTGSLPAPAALFEAVDIVDSDLFVIAATEATFPVKKGSGRNYGREVASIVGIPEPNYTPFKYKEFGDNGGLDNLPLEAELWGKAARNYYHKLERQVVTIDPVSPKSTLVTLLVERILGDLLLERGLSDRSNISLTPFRANENPLTPDAEESPISERSRAVAHRDLLALQHYAGTGTSSYKIPAIVETVENAVASASSSDIQDLLEVTTRLYTLSAIHSAGSLRQPFDALRQFLRTGDLNETGYEERELIIPPSLLASAHQGAIEIAGLISPRQTMTVNLIYQGLQKENSPPFRPGSVTEEYIPVYNGAIFSSHYDPDNPVILGSYALMDNQGMSYPVSRAFPLTEDSLFRVTGFVEGFIGDELYLEVIGQPSLLFVNTANPIDLDGDLIPDAIQDLLREFKLSAFLDTDGDGYSDLQEILDGSDPTDPNSIPMRNEAPAPFVDLSPPQVLVESTSDTSYNLSFAFPTDYRRFVEFELYASDDLKIFETTGLKATSTGSGANELNLSSSFDSEFYRFRMKLK